MQELNYQLAKEDYLDWIHWNVGRQNLKKMQKITLLVYIAFLAVYLGGNIAAKKEPIYLISNLIIVLLLGGFMFYTVSAKNQERIIWKRSGLKKLEKRGGFPTIRLILGEEGVTMLAPDDVKKEYSYADISEVEETSRLFLLGASDKTWQFVAKSAFENEEQMEMFRTFMNEKIEDAKEHPEKYVKAEESGEEGSENRKAPLIDEAAVEPDDISGEEPVIIEPVDTSNMGKIGKMAHLMASMSSEKEDGQDAGEDKDMSEGASNTEPH